MDKDSVETIELELAILIRRFASIMANKNTGNLERSAFLLLHEITAHGPAGIKALAERFHLDISTVSRQASSLEQKGYVYRIPDLLDRRSYSLQITELGTKEFSDHKQALLVKMTETLKSWSDEERLVFGQLLRKYNSSLTGL